MTVRPRYYYNLIGNICNEKEEFGTRLMHKEDLNEPYMDNTQKGSDSLLDLLNQYDEENEQLKQFQDRVFSWIDMHLQRLPTLIDDEFESDNEFADPSLYSGALQILETMKKELKGDVE